MTVTDAINKVTIAKFSLGQVVATSGVIDLVKKKSLAYNTFIIRHASGDWGDICKEDKDSNDEAVENGWRIVSSYNVGPADKIWVITEYDRSVTTLLLPSEY
jgi:hypothetical protein